MKSTSILKEGGIDVKNNIYNKKSATDKVFLAFAKAKGAGK